MRAGGFVVWRGALIVLFGVGCIADAPIHASTSTVSTRASSESSRGGHQSITRQHETEAIPARSPLPPEWNGLLASSRRFALVHGQRPPTTVAECFRPARYRNSQNILATDVREEFLRRGLAVMRILMVRDAIGTTAVVPANSSH